MELILHHYDFSNYSEKVRLVLGLKGLSWHSVEIPAYLPKPDYTPLTGGYRRTPALQIGADVTCDTQLIVDVLEALAPTPTVYPGTQRVAARAQALALVAWAEHALFRPLALYITGLHAARFPPEFHADRARLHGKPAPGLAQVQAAAPRYQAEALGQLARIEELLGAGQAYLLGAQPSLADITVYCAPWFLEHIGGRSPVLDRQPLTRAWMERIAALGHGEPAPLAASAALARAAAVEPMALPETSAPTPEGIVAGEEVIVRPLAEDAPARGRLVAVDATRITIATSDRRTGLVHVHFPRLGYRLSRAR